MVKMVKTAQGMLVDWELLNIQTQAANNVADVVEVADTTAIAARRLQRAKLDAVKKLLEQAEQAKKVEVATAAQKVPNALSASKKEKTNVGTD